MNKVIIPVIFSVLLLGLVESADAFSVDNVSARNFSNIDEVIANGNFITKEYASEIISTSPVTLSGNEASFTNHFAWMQAERVDQPNAPNFALIYRHNIGYEMEFTVNDPNNDGYTIDVDNSLRGYVTVSREEPIAVSMTSGLLLGRIDANDGNGPIHYAGFSTSGGGVNVPADATEPFVSKLFTNDKQFTSPVTYFGTNTYVVSFSSFPSPALVNIFQNFGGGEGVAQFGVAPTFVGTGDPSRPDFQFAEFLGPEDTDLSNLGHFATITVTSLAPPTELEIFKQINGPENGIFDFIIDDGINQIPITIDTSVNSGSGPILLQPGTEVTVSEIVPPGWDLVNVDCQIQGNSVGTTFVVPPFDSPIACAFTNEIIPASLTITKNAIDGDATFEFTIQTSDGASGAFINTAENNMFGPIEITPGEITILEHETSNWIPSTVICFVNGVSEGQLFIPDESFLVAGITFTADPEDNVECIFENEFTPPSPLLSINKQSVDGDGVFDFTVQSSNESFDVSIDTTEQNIFGPIEITPDDTYIVFEHEQPGWDAVFADCVVNGQFIDATVFTPNPGDNIECLFINEPIEPVATGIIYKETIGGDGIFVFTINPNENGEPENIFIETDEFDSQDFRVLAEGNLVKISEHFHPDFDLIDAQCYIDGEEVGTTFQPSPGDFIECIFTNEFLQPEPVTLTIIKNTVGGDDSFSFDVTNHDSPVDSFVVPVTTDGGTGSDTVEIEAGIFYTVTEVSPLPENWTATSISCTQNGTGIVNDFTPSSGDEIICIFTNEFIEPPISGTSGKVTAGGAQIDKGTNFGFNVQSSDGETFKGQLQYNDRNEGIKLHSKEMTLLSVDITLTSATFEGTTKDGSTFVIYVEDNGEPGRNDFFSITIDGDYQKEGYLVKGNIQIHR